MGRPPDVLEIKLVYLLILVLLLEAENILGISSANGPLLVYYNVLGLVLLIF